MKAEEVVISHSIKYPIMRRLKTKHYKDDRLPKIRWMSVSDWETLGAFEGRWGVVSTANARAWNK